MAKLTLSDVTNTNNLTSFASTLETNNGQIENAIENTLSRDGTSPNQMLADLDMNSNNILNLPYPASDTEPLRLGDIDDLLPAWFSQASAPATDEPEGSLWIDSDSASLSVYQLVNEVWVDTGITLKGTTGATGSTGSAGTNGTSVGVDYTYSTTTTDSDPGAGTFRFNNTTIASVTAGYFDNTDINAATVTSWLDSFDDSTNTSLKGMLYVRGVTDSSDFAVFNVTGSVVDGTGYRKLTLAHLASSGTWTNGQRFSFNFCPCGNKGTDGAGTGDVVGPASATDNALVRFDAATGKLVQNSGVTLSDTNVLNGATSIGIITSGSANPDLRIYDTTDGGFTWFNQDGVTYLGRLNTSGAWTENLMTVAANDAVSFAGTVTLASPAITTPTGIVKGDVGLGNVDNTSDATKNAATATLTNKTLTSPAITSPGISGTITHTGSLLLTGSTQGIEHGAVASSNTPFFDWHSSASNTDYDFRMQASGGTASSAGGTMTFDGTSFLFTGGAASDLRANTTQRVLTTTNVWSAAAEVTLTDAATVAVDMNTFINGVVTLAGNRALGNPTNEKVGQTGYIRIVQDATGSRTLSYGTDWEFAGGSAPTLTTTANAQDMLFYTVIATNRIFASLVKAIA